MGMADSSFYLSWMIYYEFIYMAISLLVSAILKVNILIVLVWFGSGWVLVWVGMGLGGYGWVWVWVGTGMVSAEILRLYHPPLIFIGNDIHEQQLCPDPHLPLIILLEFDRAKLFHSSLLHKC